MEQIFRVVLIDEEKGSYSYSIINTPQHYVIKKFNYEFQFKEITENNLFVEEDDVKILLSKINKNLFFLKNKEIETCYEIHL